MCACLSEDLYVCYCLHHNMFFATHMNSITSLRLIDAYSLAPWQEATCVFWSFALNKIHISHYWYHHVFHSPGVSHLSSFVNFILITCLPPLPPLLFMVLVILPLLLWSCLYSKHNWMKCCCLDRIGTSIVSHQSPLQMTLLCQMTFHLWKEREEKR